MSDQLPARWADEAMFKAAPIKETAVYLLWMTPDPLGAIAAMGRMYKGIPTHSLEDITNIERQRYWDDALTTHLKAPLEAVKLHFSIEGVDRSFTHQMVRQRTAVYAQESLRFAVKENLASEAIKPPSIVEASGDIQAIWKMILDEIEEAYEELINHGIPAEDARAILPHCVATRLHYITDLRALADHAGNRLCTQAQFHWRLVFTKIIEAIRNYPYKEMANAHSPVGFYDNWQFEIIANSMLFRPVCYQIGRCPFQASFDRKCSIRERVEAFHSRGVSSVRWDQEYTERPRPSADNPLPWSRAPKQVIENGELHLTPEEPVDIIPPIHNWEWLLNPNAAR